MSQIMKRLVFLLFVGACLAAMPFSSLAQDEDSEDVEVVDEDADDDDTEEEDKDADYTSGCSGYTHPVSTFWRNRTSLLRNQPVVLNVPVFIEV